MFGEKGEEQMNEEKQSQLPKQSSVAGANIAVAIMCLVIGLNGLYNLTTNPPGAPLRPIFDALILVAGLIGFAINLVVFLRLRKK
jgi:hypothetical protein